MEIVIYGQTKHESIPFFFFFFANTSEKSKGHNVHSYKCLYEEIKLCLRDHSHLTGKHLESFRALSFSHPPKIEI